jgi:hypothetical protein
MNQHVRQGDFIQTFSGGQFWPMDPRIEDINIDDIAHALSLQCRFAGHCINHYSVAEHSIHVARWVFGITGDKRKALAGLLHDAQEAYIVDVPRPLKPYLTGYKQIEESIWKCIANSYGLDIELPAEVKEADNRILIDERNQNMAKGFYAGGWPDVEPLGITLEFMSPNIAKILFRSSAIFYMS